MFGTNLLPSITTFLILILSVPISARDNNHVIKFRSPGLYPEGLTYDPKSDHFIVGSLHDQATFHTVSDAGVVQTLLTDSTLLPPNSTSSLHLAVDPTHHRLLVAVHSTSPAAYNALAAYDLKSLARVFLARIADAAAVVNGVAVDFDGNAYVTDSAGDSIWKVDSGGQASILTKAGAFARRNQAVIDAGAPYGGIGLSGIGYVSKGYLLVVQSNTGKVYKVDVDDGTARGVVMGEDLSGGDGLVVRKDGAVVVVSPTGTAWVVKSEDSWGSGSVVEKIAVSGGWVEGFPAAVTVGGGGRVYVVFGYVDEANSERNREWFRIEEVKESSSEDNLWMFILIGFGLAYFMYWRMQMGQLVKNLDRKIE